MKTTNNTNLATFTHLSALSQYCIPLGNFILPVVIWSSTRYKSEFIDFNGKQVINFQLSIFLYSLVLAMIAIPVMLLTVFSNGHFDAILNNRNFMSYDFSIENTSGIAIVAILAIVFFVCLKVAEFFLIMYAAVKASNGEKFKYPLAIRFLK